MAAVAQSRVRASAAFVPVNEALLARLRAVDLKAYGEWAESGVRFAAGSEAVEGQYWRAVRELLACIKPTHDATPILNEGGVYLGCWLESTGTASIEILDRLLSNVSKTTLEAFATHQRDDGLLPYKLTAAGPGFNQIQIVTPLARVVWNHHRLNGRDPGFLRTMYDAMARYDDWLATYRDTRRTGGVEAFAAFDTGHDLSSRFWHMPDTPFENDGRRYNPDNPLLPLVAPDLTANVACQRSYLALIAEELGEDGEEWRTKADRSIAALFEQCFDEADGFFYDRDAHGRFVRVQSDVLLRVLASEVGDDAFFARALERYLLNTRKFFAKYPFTSLAMDDPRFEPAADYNTWNGPTNALSFIRAPAAFEAHGRHVELTWVLYPILSALLHADHFAQCYSPFNGKAGYTEMYSPAILGLLDFVERISGIMPRPEGTLWFNGLVPYEVHARDVAHETAYGRTVDGHQFELITSRETTTAFRDGALLFQAPKGIRVISDRDGTIRSLVGLSINTIDGSLVTPTGATPFRIAANEQLDLNDGRLTSVRNPGLVLPTTD